MVGCCSCCLLRSRVGSVGHFLDGVSASFTASPVPPTGPPAIRRSDPGHWRALGRMVSSHPVLSRHGRLYFTYAARSAQRPPAKTSMGSSVCPYRLSGGIWRGRSPTSEPEASTTLSDLDPQAPPAPTTQDACVGSTPPRPCLTISRPSANLPDAIDTESPCTVTPRQLALSRS